MGQYWIPVNLDKREFISPHKLGDGLKLWEQLANGAAAKGLVILLAAMPEPRGGGDLQPDPIIGRWAGDRIALVGDYAEDGDLTPKEGDPPASAIYGLCTLYPEPMDPLASEIREQAEVPAPFTDITDAVCAVIERELDGKFIGTGWRRFVRTGEVAA